MQLFSPTSSITQFLSFLFATPTGWMLALALLAQIALDGVSPPRRAGSKRLDNRWHPPFYRVNIGLLIAGTVLWVAMAWGSLSPALWSQANPGLTSASVGLILFSLLMVGLWSGCLLSWLRHRRRD